MAATQKKKRVVFPFFSSRKTRTKNRKRKFFFVKLSVARYSLFLSHFSGVILTSTLTPRNRVKGKESRCRWQHVASLHIYIQITYIYVYKDMAQWKQRKEQVRDTAFFFFLHRRNTLFFKPLSAAGLRLKRQNRKYKKKVLFFETRNEAYIEKKKKSRFSVEIAFSAWRLASVNQQLNN